MVRNRMIVIAVVIAVVIVVLVMVIGVKFTMPTIAVPSIVESVEIVVRFMVAAVAPTAIRPSSTTSARNISSRTAMTAGIVGK
jgi:hypothetical protein